MRKCIRLSYIVATLLVLSFTMYFALDWWALAHGPERYMSWLGWPWAPLATMMGICTLAFMAWFHDEVVIRV